MIKTFSTSALLTKYGACIRPRSHWAWAGLTAQNTISYLNFKKKNEALVVFFFM